MAGPEPETLDPAALWAHPQFASTLANGLAILGCFGGGAAVLGNKDLSDRLGMARPTVSRLTFTLVALGYLRRDGQTAKYSLGPAVLSLGYPLLAQLAVRQVAAPAMLELARHARGPVSLGTRDRLQVVYVETVQANDSNETKPDIGSTRPILRTAIGRALLHGLQPAERASVIERLIRAFPEDWEAHGHKLETAFREIEARGFCIVASDWRPTLAAVGVPMRGAVNGMSLAFNLTVSSYSTDRKFLEKNLGPRLVGMVTSVEYKLGLLGR